MEAEHLAGEKDFDERIPHPPSEPQAWVLDTEALKELMDAVGGDFAILDELILTFLEDAPQSLHSLSDAIKQGNIEEVRRLAHSMKSNGRDLGAEHFTEICKQLEQGAKLGDMEKALELFRELTEVYLSVEASLKAIHQAGVFPV